MSEAHVRPATMADLAASWECDAYAHSSAQRKSYIERAIRQQQCLLAEVANQVAGFAVLNHEFFEQGFISLVVVSSRFRRRGIGLLLLRNAEAVCRTSKVFSSTNASNQLAQALFNRAGFSRSGVVENLDPADPEYIYFKEVRRT